MFEEQLHCFIHFLKFEKRFSSHTVIAYENDILQFFTHLSSNFQLQSLSLVTHFHIRSWLAGIKESNQKARSINRKMSSLNSFYKFLMKTGVVDKNPAHQLHAQKLPERLPTYMKETETSFLLDTINFDEGFKGLTDRLICEIFYSTGIRRNELLQLKECDIEWGLEQIRILGKGNKERLVPVSEVMLDFIRVYIGEKRKLLEHDDVFLFNLDTGLPLYPMYIYRVVNQYLALSTTLHKKSPHILRHTFATHLLNNGASIQSIKELLGHSSLASTQIYAHNNISKLKEIHRQNHPRG